MIAYNLYYKGQRIDFIRNYHYAGTEMAEIRIGDSAPLYVKRSDLKEENELTKEELLGNKTFKLDPSENAGKSFVQMVNDGSSFEDVKKSIDESVASAEDKPSKVTNMLTEAVDELVDSLGIKTEAPQKTDDEYNVEEVEKWIEELPEELPESEETEVESEEETAEEDVEESSPTILAKKVATGYKKNIGELDSETFTAFVKRNKLDTNAINNVLNGKSKTHKGYTFSFED